MQHTGLRHEAGMPAQTTLRAQLKRLEQVGAVEARRRDRFPGTLEYGLTAAGHDLLFVATTVERWLSRAPCGALQSESDAAKTAIRAFAEGWSTTMLRALATSPLSLTELDRAIVSLSYPSLERRLGALRLAGQVEAKPGNGRRGTPYLVTRWAREGAGPLAAAMRWELRHLRGDAAQLGPADAEAIFLLAAPLLKAPASVSGSCRIAMELPGNDGPRLAGALVTIERGRLASCTSRLRGEPDAWALGSASAWLEVLIHADTDRIEPGGNTRLARAVLEALHDALFGGQPALVT